MDHFELRRGDRDYHFLIHEPLGVSVQFFFDLSRGSLPIYYVKDLASRMLHALDFIQCPSYPCRFDDSLDYMQRLTRLTLDLQAKNILLRIQDQTVLKDGEEAEITYPSSRKSLRRLRFLKQETFLDLYLAG